MRERERAVLGKFPISSPFLLSYFGNRCVLSGRKDALVIVEGGNGNVRIKGGNTWKK